MITTYLKSKNKDALQELRVFVLNIMEPQQGREAVTGLVDANNTPVSDLPACGDVSFWYTSVLAPFPIMPYGDIEACSVADGKAVCGVWS